jgi:hypothetical protein
MSLQSNVIEAGPNMQRESEKEWYYGNADKERLGPYSFEEVCIITVMTIDAKWLLAYIYYLKCVRTWITLNHWYIAIEKAIYLFFS